VESCKVERTVVKELDEYIAGKISDYHPQPPCEIFRFLLHGLVHDFVEAG